jgi:hypothetical protein
MKQNSNPPDAFGRELPLEFVRTDLDDLSTAETDSELDLHIARLLALHPSLPERFRVQHVASLDDSAKKHLLAEINAVLGVIPLAKGES